MNYKYLVLFMFVLYKSALASPVLKEIGSLFEELEPEGKIREKRKIELLQHLQEGGVEVKKVVKEDDEKEVSESLVSLDTPAETEGSGEEATRAKKHAVDNVGGTGKTSCGKVISARTPGTRMLLRSNAGVPEMGPMKTDRYPSMESRTFDSIFPLSSLASSVTYAVPTTYTDTATIGHTIAAPALAAPALPALPLAPVAHVEPVSLLSHSIPLPMHSMHAMLATHHPLLNFQRIELPKLPEVIYTPAEIKQPTYEVNSVVATRPAAAPVVYPSRYGVVNSGYSSGPMICHPYDEKLSQQVIQIRPEVHVIDSSHKTINDTVEGFKSEDVNSDDERKVHEHLRQVNEIREEINQLNRAAQRIVDQQERLAEMQQKYLWKNGEKTGSFNPHDYRMYMYPPSYSRASAIAYPNRAEDVEFFINMLKTGKKIGTLSETFQPVLTSASDAIRLALTGEQNSQKEASQTGTNQDSNTRQQNTTI